MKHVSAEIKMEMKWCTLIALVMTMVRLSERRSIYSIIDSFFIDD